MKQQHQLSIGSVFLLIANVLFAVITIGSLIMVPFYGQPAVISLIVTLMTAGIVFITVNGLNSMLILTAIFSPPGKEKEGRKDEV